MAEDKSFIVEVEKARDAKDGRPSMGPVYRSCFTKDVSPPPIQGLDTCWDVFRSLSFLPHTYFRRSRFLFYFLFPFLHDTTSKLWFSEVIAVGNVKVFVLCKHCQSRTIRLNLFRDL